MANFFVQAYNHMYNIKMNTMANTVTEGMNAIHKNTQKGANP